MSERQNPEELTLVGQRRELHPNEVVLAEPEVLQIAVGGSPLSTAKACLAELVRLYGAEAADEAMRKAVRERGPVVGGRRRGSGSHILDDVLYAAFDEARFRDLGPSAAHEFVVAAFGAEGERAAVAEGLLGRRLQPDSISRRLKAARRARADATPT